ncbi:hypothetical protein BS47DRAFT_1045337 [Hydnum rufescens UP504]|uniref:Uncharacterized protein n=1 Tax=Hydnum rufescens UP504 TaxID=1448309 RepID=A0A9P6AV41_9AGAM|nr:hypothetical protein BS47DRAFT_1045337 [Hydnum rufescens UP504]
MTTDPTDKTGRATPPPPSKPVKKKSTHVDLIDQLDYSGLGGGTFHHDGPFDALAPSRNRNGQKAPMSAFNDADQLDDPTAPDPTQLHRRKNSDSPYAIATTYIGTTGVNRYSEPLKSPVKSALAEAWGRADPEPFEEFSAGGYSAAPSTYAESVESEEGAPSGKISGKRGQYVFFDPCLHPLPLKLTRHVMPLVAARNARRNTRIAPPPQPIILPGSVTDSGFEPPSASPPLSPVTAKRNRSIMNRFRRRANSSSLPAPLPDRDDIASSPESQSGMPWDGQLPSPTTPDEYVIIDNGRPITVMYAKDRPAGAIDYRSRPPLTQKALPDPPADDYLTQSTMSEGGRAGSPGIRLGRKSSLYKKVKGLGARVASR